MRALFLLILSAFLLTVFSPGHTFAQGLQTLYFIGGQILDNSGNPACGVRVCAFAEDADSGKPNVTLPCSISDKEGKFSIAVKEPGRYRLFSDQIHNGYWPQNQPFFRDPALEITEVIVNDSTPRVPITIYQPSKNGILVGRSIDTRTGLPVDDVEFVLCLVASPEICRTTNSKHADGSFRIPAPFVPFTFRATAKGYHHWLGPRGEGQGPMSVASGSTTQLNVLLIRHRDDGSLPIEMEKQPGVHLPAPSQLAPEDATTYNHFPRSTKLEWSAVEGAVSYSVEIDYCRGGQQKRDCVDPQLLTVRSNPPMEGITGTEYQFFFIGAQPGRWRVWAIDKNGREGFKSPWRTFFYLK